MLAGHSGGGERAEHRTGAGNPSQNGAMVLGRGWEDGRVGLWVCPLSVANVRWWAYAPQRLILLLVVWPSRTSSWKPACPQNCGLPPTVRWGPREVDVDLVFYDDLVANFRPELDLVVPHERAHIQQGRPDPPSVG